jgi:peptidoglycan/xylan/chitin deacetylase (PgdA/CDA1 family)
MQTLFRLPWRSLPSWFIDNRLHILMYHSIADNPRDPHAILPDEFRKHMQVLRSKHVVSLQQGLEVLRSGRSLRGVYVITFDDALLDFYTNAMPVIQQFGYPITMFVPTGLVGQYSAWDSYDKSKLLMNWHQMEECEKHQVVFGSHTVNHVRLIECADDVILEEMRVSLQMLRDHLENVLPTLAYPGGYQDSRVRSLVRSAGYDCALGASSRWGNGSESDLFQLCRERFNLRTL